MKALRRLGSAWRREVVEGCRLWRGRLRETPMSLVVTGEGRRLAREGAQCALRSLQPRFVVGVGVAGALSPDLSLGDVVVSSQVGLESGERLEAFAPLVLSALEIGLEPAMLLTCDRVVGGTAEKEKLWRDLESPRAATVDMESFDFAAASRHATLLSLITANAHSLDKANATRAQ